MPMVAGEWLYQREARLATSWTNDDENYVSHELSRPSVEACVSVCTRCGEPFDDELWSYINEFTRIRRIEQPYKTCSSCRVRNRQIKRDWD